MITPNSFYVNRVGSVMKKFALLQTKEKGRHFRDSPLNYYFFQLET